MNIPLQRMMNHLIAAQQYGDPVQSVAWMGAMQAQDYPASLWAVGLRTEGASEGTIEQALETGGILRTWLLRGTLHLVASADVRWLLDLLGNRNIRATKPRFKQLELDDEIISKSRKAITRILKGGNRVTREDVFKALECEGIPTRAQRGFHILWRLSQEGQICFGPRQGSRHTFVLLEDWVPAKDSSLTGDNALQALALRFIRSHGPASLADFAWWSGLTSKTAAAGLELAEPFLERVQSAGQNYWYPSEKMGADPGTSRVHLLPAFDEYLLGYKDRSQVLDPQHARRLNDGGGIIKSAILVDGIIRGTWKKKVLKGTTWIIPEWFDEIENSNIEEYCNAAKRWAEFSGVPFKIAEDAARDFSGTTPDDA